MGGGGGESWGFGGCFGRSGGFGLRMCCFGASVKGYDVRVMQSEGL